jgi:hypothetical protein
LTQRKEKREKQQSQQSNVAGGAGSSLSERRRTYTTLKGYEVMSEKADLKDTRKTSFWKYQGPIWKNTLLQIDFE